MNRLCALVVLALALPARADMLAPAATDEQAREARSLIQSNNGAGARGCLSERQVYEACHRVDAALAWNPDNPVDWYVGRNTIGLFESLVTGVYGEASRAWNAAVNGTDFKAIGAPCRAARTPRSLAACFDDRVREYFADHADIRPSLGGACKMYAATLVAVSSYFPSVTEQASVIASAHHAFNWVSIRDDAGRDHMFLIDALNNMSIQLSGDDGACPDEGTLAPAGGGAANAASAREHEGQEAAGRRVAGIVGASP